MRIPAATLIALALTAFGAGAFQLEISRADGPRYARSFRALNGSIYLLGPFKSTDGGRSVVLCGEKDPPWGRSLHEHAMNVHFERKGLFLGVRTKFVCAPDGRCTGKVWRSSDGLRSLEEMETVLEIPEAGRVDSGQGEEWVGLFFHRRILELPDGSLLGAMYGNFEQDTIVPTNPRSKSEIKYKARAFVVRSADDGRTWRYLSTVAVPSPEVVDDTEGFNEWSLVRLADGRLLGIVRTGHYTPLMATWSSDNGKSWSEPVPAPGIGPGCDPYLLALSDGRLALAYGQIVQPGEPREQYWRDYQKRADHRRRWQRLEGRNGRRLRPAQCLPNDFRSRTQRVGLSIRPGPLARQASSSQLKKTGDRHKAQTWGKSQ